MRALNCGYLRVRSGPVVLCRPFSRCAGVVSCVFWCSVSAFSLAAIRMTMSRAASRMDKPIGASGAAADLMAQRIR